MQTFLPYPDFEESAKALDRLRLGKQRVEVFQILRALRSGGGWVHHPAVKMWKGHEDCLIRYGEAICAEWTRRGYKSTINYDEFRGSEATPPPWLGREDFHASHRSNLLRKSPDYYGKFGWTEGPDLPYVWP
jgi:hypothetical protein